LLFINWRKHYDVPSSIYSYNTFKQNRKAKFFFLSDFVFKLIHKYCFRRVFYYYIEYLFNKRLLNSCIHLTSLLYNKHLYIKHIKSNLRYTQPNLKNLTLHKINSKVNFLFHYNYFNLIFKLILSNIKKNILVSKDIYIFYYYIVFKYKYFNRKYILFTKKTYRQNFLLLKNCQIDTVNTSDLLFSLHQLKKFRLILRKKSFFLYTKSKFCSLILVYIKNIFFFYNKNNNKEKSINNKVINHLNNMSNKIKNITFILNTFSKVNLYLKKVWTLAIKFNVFSNTLHTSLYYYLFLKKRTVLDTYKFLNYYNFANLKLKKDLLFTFKKNLFVFNSKIEKVRFRNRKYFYFFLNNLLNSKQWLIGPTNKIKLFRYLTHMCFRIRDSFMHLHILKGSFAHNNNNKVSFFYNSLHIRKELLFFLGKKRYKDEFLFLNNKKWYLNYYLKWYYNLNFKTMFFYYNLINKKYKVKLLKDLFLFLEYNIPIFIKKYLSYNFSGFINIYLNNNLLNNNFKSFFFIGDYIKLDVKYSSYYEKFLVFFNFLFFINPIKLKKKHALLHLLYKKTYSFFNNYIFYRNNTSHSVLKHNLINKNTFIYLNKYISLISNNLLSFSINNKRYIKSILFFIYKYNLFFIINNFSIYNKKIIVSNSNYNSIDFKDWLFIYSFGKTISKFFLIKFRNLIKKNRKQLKNVLKRKENKYYKKYFKVSKNIYNWLLHQNKVKNSRVYKSVFSNTFNKNVHYIYFLKKYNFLYSKKKFSNIIYKSSF